MSRECWEFGRLLVKVHWGCAGCRVAKDRGRINSSAGRCLTLRCSQTPDPLTAFRCRAAPHSLMQGRLCRGCYWGPEWPLASPGWVVWACAPCASPTPALTPPLPQSSGGCSRRPRCVWPPVWPRLCLVSALPALPQLLAYSPYPCPPAADLVPDLHLPWCLVQPVQLLPGDIQLRPLLLGDPSFPE